jgi:hypothetical protein
MSNKSLFEKLFEEVMQDDAKLTGIPSEEGDQDTGETGDDLGMGEDSDEVTLTLDRETAQKLHDLLGGILGGDEEGEGEGEEGEGEEGGMKAPIGIEDMDQEDAEENEYDEDEDEDSEETMSEAPQSKYEKFETKGKAEQLQKQSNSRVQGAVANKTSAHGKAEKTSQTQGTEHYMPFTKKVDQAKPGGSIKVNNPKYNPSGQGDSIFG